MFAKHQLTCILYTLRNFIRSIIGEQYDELLPPLLRLVVIVGRAVLRGRFLCPGSNLAQTAEQVKAGLRAYALTVGILKL